MLIRDRKELSTKITEYLSSERVIGFVPTMGNLHKGHAELIKACRKNNDITIVSIFANPKQFKNEKEVCDYPKTIDDDICICENLGVDLIFYPRKSDLFVGSDSIIVHETPKSDADKTLRRGFGTYFNEMLTIVIKLINIIKPSEIFLGEKDYTQYVLVKNMVEEFFLDVKVTLCQTVRNERGLPLSSCHNLLTKKEMEIANLTPVIIRKSIDLNEVRLKLSDFPIKIEYLIDIDRRRHFSFKIGNTRLTDNFELKK